MATAAVPLTPLACTVYLECTSGIGDMIFDAAAGVAVAVARGCVRPRVRTRWQHENRKYDWPTLFASDLFVMDAPLPARGHFLGKMYVNGGWWPRSFYNFTDQVHGPGAREDLVVVTYQHTLTKINGTSSSCGAHAPRSWMSPITPHVPVATFDTIYGQVLRSVRVLNTTALPAAIGERVVIHYRRGDKLKQGEKLIHQANGTSASASDSRAVFERIDEAVLRWVRRTGRPAHLITDDPQWGAQYVSRLRKAGIDTSFLPHSTPINDLAAMMGSKVVVRAAMVSHFSDLACTLSGVPLVAFPAHLSMQMHRQNAPVFGLTLPNSTVADGEGGAASEAQLHVDGDRGTLQFLNVTYLDLDRFLAQTDAEASAMASIDNNRDEANSNPPQGYTHPHARYTEHARHAGHTAGASTRVASTEHEPSTPVLGVTVPPPRPSSSIDMSATSPTPSERAAILATKFNLSNEISESLTQELKAAERSAASRSAGHVLNHRATSISKSSTSPDEQVPCHTYDTRSSCARQ